MLGGYPASTAGAAVGGVVVWAWPGPVGMRFASRAHQTRVASDTPCASPLGAYYTVERVHIYMGAAPTPLEFVYYNPESIK